MASSSVPDQPRRPALCPGESIAPQPVRAAEAPVIMASVFQKESFPAFKKKAPEGRRLAQFDIDVLLGDRQVPQPPKHLKDEIDELLANLTPATVRETALALTPSVALNPSHHAYFADRLVVVHAAANPSRQLELAALAFELGSRDVQLRVKLATISCAVKLSRLEKLRTASSARTLFRNVGSFLGLMTLARNEPIDIQDFNFAEMVLKGLVEEKLLAFVPFIARTLQHVVVSNVFNLPHPWTLQICALLVELTTTLPGLKSNIKHEVSTLLLNLGCSTDEIVAKAVLPKDHVPFAVVKAQVFSQRCSRDFFPPPRTSAVSLQNDESEDEYAASEEASDVEADDHHHRHEGNSKEPQGAEDGSAVCHNNTVSSVLRSPSSPHQQQHRNTTHQRVSFAATCSNTNTTQGVAAAASASSSSLHSIMDDYDTSTTTNSGTANSNKAVIDGALPVPLTSALKVRFQHAADDPIRDRLRVLEGVLQSSNAMAFHLPHFSKEQRLVTQCLSFTVQLKLLHSSLALKCTDASCSIMRCARVEYLWRDNAFYKRATAVSAPHYAHLSFAWITKRLSELCDDSRNNTSADASATISPTKSTSCSGSSITPAVSAAWITEQNRLLADLCTVQQFSPRLLEDIIKPSFKKLFRIFAHLLVHHMDDARDLGEEVQLTAAFRQFMLFAWDPHGTAEEDDVLVSTPDCEPVEDLLVNLMGDRGRQLQADLRAHNKALRKASTANAKKKA